MKQLRDLDPTILDPNDHFDSAKFDPDHLSDNELKAHLDRYQTEYVDRIPHDQVQEYWDQQPQPAIDYDNLWHKGVHYRDWTDSFLERSTTPEKLGCSCPDHISDMFCPGWLESPRGSMALFNPPIPKPEDIEQAAHKPSCRMSDDLLEEIGSCGLFGQQRTRLFNSFLPWNQGGYPNKMIKTLRVPVKD
ncbi:MAG: hypothetical protein Q9225_002800 [Loekoesia sp. 1 TL-2023]